MDCIIGADVGGTFTKMALMDVGGEIIIRKRFSSNGPLGRDYLVENLVTSILELKEKCDQEQKSLLAVGMGVAGLIKSREGVVSFSPNLPHLKEFPMVEIIQERTNLPSFIDNDVNMIALGEKWMGAGKDLGDFLLITLGTGVGGGLILNGQVWAGSFYSAAEVGHMSLDIRGSKCNCGGTGCLETFASATWLIRKAKRRIRDGEKSIITDLVHDNLDNLTAEHLYHAACKGDELSIDLFREMGGALGLCIANIINLLGIRSVIIGGGVSSSWDLFIGALLDQMRVQVLSVPAENIQVLRSVLGDDGGIFGSAKMALKRLGKGEESL